jgi:hypothetical protein
MSKLLRVAGLAATVVVLAAGSALAAKGGHQSTAAASCFMSGNVVYGSGLPTGEVINFMLSDASGKTGWVLGYTPDGTWMVNVPSPNGATSYEFVSRTFGPSGSKYNVFASCSA